MNRFSRLDPLSLVAYLTLAGVTAAGLWQMDRILLRWLALGLLVGFGLLQGRLSAYGPGREPAESWQLAPGGRRRANLIVAAQTGLVVALIETTGVRFPLVFLFFILSVTAMLYNPLRWGLPWLAGFTLLTGWFFFEQGGLAGGLQAMATYAGGYLFFGIITNALTQARLAQRQNALLLRELQAKNRQLEAYAAQVETLAAVEERNRLAREMHDTIGHRLTAAAVQLDGAERLVAHEPERAAALIGGGRQQVRDALQDLRRTVGRLREPVEVELPLPQALRRLAAGFQEATGLVVHLELPEAACEMTAAQRLALYRTAQEGLTNIQRHAKARQAWLRLECSADRLALHVSDDGLGLADPASGGGFGLAGLRERAAQLGGTVTLANRPDGGAILTIQLPALPILPQVQNLREGSSLREGGGVNPWPPSAS